MPAIGSEISEPDKSRPSFGMMIAGLHPFFLSKSVLDLRARGGSERARDGSEYHWPGGATVKTSSGQRYIPHTGFGAPKYERGGSALNDPFSLDGNSDVSASICAFGGVGAERREGCLTLI